MADILIRGGTVVDGTGTAGFRADVRLRGDTIAEIGPDLQHRSERIVDAAGCYVTPGFIEAHTHYDGTMWWQPDLDPLPGYGVTTTVMGNCGFSVAPVSDDPAVRMEMVKIFSFFEDIPSEPFVSEVRWDWKTWSEYKHSLASKVKVSANVASFVGHIALRLAVMGVQAWERAATATEIERMAALLEDALRAGALGLSSNLHDHDGDDRPIPTLMADDAEFKALIAVLDCFPGSSLQVIVDTFMRKTGPQATDRIARLCEGHAVRVQWAGVPTLQFQKDIQAPMIEQHERFKREGRDFWTGFTHVSPTYTLSVNRSLIFAQSNDYAWHEVVTAETEAAKLALLRDPEWRARARHSWDHEAWRHSPMARPQDLLLLNSDNGVGPIKLSVAEYAEQLGVHASDAMAEWLIKNGLQSTVHLAPFAMDEEMVVRLLKDPYTVGNISDAGAHGQMLCGGGENMVLFTHYVQETAALTVEEAVHVQTGKLAKHFSLHDRGEIKVGKRADITVFHLDEIKHREMKKVFDVPDGNGGNIWRWTRDPAPVRLTVVNGIPTFEGGKFTGAFPGQLIGPVLQNVE
ncbi:N-acyl-D-amino-acid deacylase family protein [Noviherbaspirillum saxi]|uniref:D-aminoacylase n=1 Tax=Noviherbaspirillum saxi TaxID=2320863 RepID=A0A3A3FJ36_9BURK|nr:amidohydrolase family protein [Noviherbaspirillum saxi]RJF92564.1 D-aminoacylase [Noviherbaspirillum saxi]